MSRELQTYWRRALTGCLLALMLGVGADPAMAFGRGGARLNPIEVITIDDDGRSLRYPSALFFEPIHQEIFLVNGGSSRVVVYNDDHFPLVSMGRGRGVHAPRGVYVTDDGTVYVAQSRSASNPSPRITLLNGAFFVIREIIFSEIPELADFSPSNLAVSRDGTIYLAGGSTTRGVLVLDNEGNFLRRLEPMGLITDQEAIAAAARQPEQAKWLIDPEEAAQALEEFYAADSEDQQLRQALTEAGRALGSGRADSDPAGAARTRPEAYGDIPGEFRPRGSQQEGEAPEPGLGPVKVAKVVIDSDDRLYLVSAETGKIYVYDASETFLFSFGTKGGTPGKLSQPRGVVVDRQREVFYVADYMRHVILAYDFTGKFLFEVGGFGPGPGWFNFPADIAIDRRGRLIVADLFNRRVQILEVEREADSTAAPPAAPATTPEPPADPEPADFPLVDPGSYPEDPVIEEEILPEEPISP